MSSSRDWPRRWSWSRAGAHAGVGRGTIESAFRQARQDVIRGLLLIERLLQQVRGVRLIRSGGRFSYAA